MEDELKTDSKAEEWFVKIKKVNNGYILYNSDGTEDVVEEDERDELKVHEALLWKVMEAFNFQGSKHDPERLRVVREKPNGEVSLCGRRKVRAKNLRSDEGKSEI